MSPLAYVACSGRVLRTLIRETPNICWTETSKYQTEALKVGERSRKINCSKGHVKCDFKILNNNELQLMQAED